MTTQIRRSVLLALAVLAAVGAAAMAVRLRSSVRGALNAPLVRARPLSFVALSAPRPVERWGGADILAVAAGPSGLLLAGSTGVVDERGPLLGLPTLQVCALTLWRGRPAAGPCSGGLYLWAGERWEEARSGWGTLHVRALAETPAGELLVGAREGLFRAGWAAGSLERLDPHPVRAVADGAGFILAGGEQGLFRVEPSRAVLLATPDPWIEAVALESRGVVVVTAVGLARGPIDGPLATVPGGEAIVSAVLQDGALYGVGKETPAVLKLDAEGRRSEEVLPADPLRLLTAGGSVFADTTAGLCRRGADGWRLVRPRDAALPGTAHVGALAWLGSRLVAGLFDGGLAVAEPRAGALAWHAVPGSSAWGVNALLSAGGAVWVASLRGAARFDGTALKPLEGPGAAYSLASTPEGVAIGYGQGVLLPGPRLLSAFHGLPGNQALALASGDALYVGTPSGLGAVVGRRVRWRVGAGEGRLPHPWITALALSDQALYVGTYGGGVARRVAGREGEAGRFQSFAETEGLKINTGCLVEAGGRVFAGTDGAGLLRLSRDRSRFERMRLALPSPRVTALLASADALYIGTDEGLARLPLAAASEELTQ